VQVVVKFAFVEKLGVLGVSLFKFDGNFEVGLDVDALIDFSEGTLVYFA
jgi:hypothetical protein